MTLKNRLLFTLYGAAGLSIILVMGTALGVTEQASLDFQWDAARVLLHRANPYALALNGQDPQLLPDVFVPNQFPSALMLLWGYAVFPWAIAKVLWVFSNLGFSITILLLLCRLYAPTLSAATTLFAGALWVSGYVWRLHMGLGQHTLFSLCFFLLALFALRQKREGWAGVWLAIALFKYTTVLPLCLLFLYRRAWKPLAVASAIQGGCMYLRRYGSGKTLSHSQSNPFSSRNASPRKVV